MISLEQNKNNQRTEMKRAPLVGLAFPGERRIL